MRDAVTSLIGKYDLTGRYLDRNAFEDLKSYFDSGMARIYCRKDNQCEILPPLCERASAKLFEEVPELLRPGGICLYHSSLFCLSAGSGLLLALC